MEVPGSCGKCGLPSRGARGATLPALPVADGARRLGVGGGGSRGAPGSGERRPATGGLRIAEEIGRGGMGVVYRARQRRLDRIVAVKLLLIGGPEALRTAGGSAAGRLHHPHIVATHDYVLADGQPYLSMDWVNGTDLGVLLRGGLPPPEVAARHVFALAEAVHYAHGQGILHRRDLKPSNVLIDAHGQPRLTDFGLAKTDRGRTGPDAHGAAGRVTQLQAPEQVSSRPDGVGPDIHALGAILYHGLTGRPPFRSELAGDAAPRAGSRSGRAPLPGSVGAARSGGGVPEVSREAAGTEGRSRRARDLAEGGGCRTLPEPVRSRRIGTVERARPLVPAESPVGGDERCAGGPLAGGVHRRAGRRLADRPGAPERRFGIDPPGTPGPGNPSSSNSPGTLRERYRRRARHPDRPPPRDPTEKPRPSGW